LNDDELAKTTEKIVFIESLGEMLPEDKDIALELLGDDAITED